MTEQITIADLDISEEQHQADLDNEQDDVLEDPDELADLYRDVYLMDFDQESGGRMLAELMRDLQRLRKVIHQHVSLGFWHLAQASGAELALDEMLLARARDRAEVRLSRMKTVRS